MTARPLTQQGMSGMSAAAPSSRKVQDGHYFYAKLSEKRSQILDVNAKLRQELDALAGSKDIVLEQMDRSEELKQETQDLEFQLQHYNLVVQKGSVSASASSVQQDVATLQVRAHHALHTTLLRRRARVCAFGVHSEQRWRRSV